MDKWASLPELTRAMSQSKTDTCTCPNYLYHMKTEATITQCVCRLLPEHSLMSQSHDPLHTHTHSIVMLHEQQMCADSYQSTRLWGQGNTSDI